MTSYDDRPNSNPWASPVWAQPPGLPRIPPPRTPGIETRQVLLVLGAACLVAALAAGTAVVWHALGPTGQAALMLAVTATVLTLAVRLDRLPATAQALAAVGVAGMLIDVVAGRSLELAGLRALPLHVYAGIAASLVAVVLAALAVTVRRLWAPPIGVGVAATVATVAWVQPTSVDRAAWLGVAGATVAVLVERVLASSGSAALVGRFVNAALAIPLVWIGAAAAVVASMRHTSGVAGGVVLVVALLALPEASGMDSSDVGIASSAFAGLLAGALAVAATWQLPDVQVILAAGMGALGLFITALQVRGPAVRIRRAVQAAALTVVVTSYALVSHQLSSFVRINAAYAVLCVAVAFVWRSPVGDAVLLRAMAAAAAVPFATAAADIQLHLDRVTAAEAYVLVPALGLLALGAVAMLHWPESSSWMLAPGLVLGLLPTVSMALGVDRTRQALALVAAAALVVIGAQLRLAAPLSVGAAVLSLLVLRLVGPEMKRVPEWVALGVVGVVLLVLGGTWERRMLDARRAAHAIRPRIAALR